MSPAELRRLMELAAKAAGYTTTHKWNAGRLLLDPPVISLVVHRDGELVTTGWNPADDDGDSRRLEVKLRIKSRYHSVLGQGLAWTEGDAAEFTANVEDCGRDECAATRLAVLRAAAAIGEAMP